MKKQVRPGNVNDLDFIYDELKKDFDEQGILYRFKYTKEEFKNLLFGQHSIASTLILMSEEAPIGFAIYAIDYRNFTVLGSSTLYINDLYIIKSHRRKRAATFLFDAIKEIAIKEKCGRLEGVVLKDNESAMNFYQNFLHARVMSSFNYMRLDLDK
jgi:ribosomal protein S18 acetylase RimI-like enzyme